MTLIQDEYDINQSLKRERATLAFLLTLIAVFMFFDIFADWYEGSSALHLVPEIIIGTIGLGTAAFLFIRFAQSRHRALFEARKEILQAKTLASEWQGRASSFRMGLTEAINRQLELWGLTEAEREVSYLLLKGFSLQEIAGLRETSEGTVRQQASIVYKKSGLNGRTQLSAFFLEDLLMPSER